MDTPVETAQTLDGASVISFGVAKRRWTFEARVAYTPESGYASLSDVEGWFSDATVAGNKFKFQDLKDTTIYDVLLANKGEYRPAPMSVTMYDADAVWSVHMEFIQQ
jgi:hypothetical protein